MCQARAQREYPGMREGLLAADKAKPGPTAAVTSSGSGSVDGSTPQRRRGSLQGQDAASAHKLSACRKLAFAVGGIPSPLSGIILTFYLSPFLLETARVRPAAVGVIVLVGRVCDAFTDPLIGALSDRTQTRIGRRRPWLFLSVVPFAISYFACFVTWEYFGVDLTQTAKVYYYMVAYCLMQAITTCYSVPYAALTMELSEDQYERDAATSWRMVMELTATAGTVYTAQVSPLQSLESYLL